MSYFTHLSDLNTKDIVPGFHAQLVHTEGMSVMHVRIDAGSELPEHYHVHEQVSNMISGEFEFTVGGEQRRCRAGDIAVIPSNVPHSGRAVTDCYIIDVFLPVREDYK